MAQKPKRTKSGSAWMHEHVTDAYVKKAQQDGFRSRAAYKLLEIDSRDHLLHPGMTVVDLGAAPGSWCQVAVQKMKRQGRVLAIDLLPVAPLPGVEALQGDFTAPDTLAWLENTLQAARVDLVLSDMAPNMSGVMLRDQARHYELCELALDFAVNWLKPDGAFLVKVFQGSGFEDFRNAMRRAFDQVVIRKPDASRDRSSEVYLLGRRPVKLESVAATGAS
ncbi:cell division protein FtsJ [Thiobacillus denitrificans ATCC 25259]|uniref:Ribosomal RNA large subunit methyltransferase E n=1 Tax=Thiobacillus denitrificans (strain ATCC 25259 / T1) TaxID=292415 RepID=RLME_THIDA|nr:RlmE family RNA methyltransferase [Thiobacillus denitrificans]Q3SJR5.1 RecName: Full=Ribosomal RNA large subunit methyltransferase E; AltName: Full=23S rRNA Um2552 methyltransferase; AltName: Full=rRNA (uridine-2'-O-)-methyltransferase [Thiobacillus denitrificans ATCC 25259]AAZ97085.1 cell division protein FtsJ [Thiobacillus denitrificans ATCC 25259]